MFVLFWCERLMVFRLVDLEREEKVVQKAIREAAKRNDMGSAKVVQVFQLKMLLNHE